MDTVATSTSDADGLYNVRDVPVGRYTVAVDESSIGDTVQVARVDTTDFALEHRRQSERERQRYQEALAAFELLDSVLREHRGSV